MRGEALDGQAEERVDAGKRVARKQRQRRDAKVCVEQIGRPPRVFAETARAALPRKQRAAQRSRVQHRCIVGLVFPRRAAAAVG
jgi:hypothetical protein